MVSRASFSELVIITAGEVGPCSAWPSRSVAQISPSTLSSAIISVSVGPAKQVDADAAEQLPLGFRHIGVAGADDHVDRLDALGAERHGGDRLHAAQHVDVVGAAEMHGGDDGRMRPALERRRAGDDAFHAGDLGGDDRHMRGGDHRIAPARHVAADRVHRDVAVAEHDAGQRFHFQIVHAVALLLREVAHLGLGKFDVFEVALTHLRNGASRFRRARV